MGSELRGPWFNTMVCSNYGLCSFHGGPSLHGKEPRHACPFFVCPKCGSELKVDTGRFICEEYVKSSLFGLIKTKEWRAIGFELLIEVNGVFASKGDWQ